jgi:hypothetical protein
MTEGIDSFRDADVIQRNIICTISSSPLGEARTMRNDMHQREIAVLRDWRDDHSLPTAVRNFARKAERYLLDDLTQWDRFEEDYVS